MNHYACKTTMRGYALCCADLINIFDRADLAKKLLQEADISARDIEKMDLEGYDYQALSDVLKDMARAA